MKTGSEEECRHPANAYDRRKTMPIEAKETIVAGGAAEDYMTVRHLVLRGSQLDIGRHIAAFAQNRYDFCMEPSSDQLMTRVNREMFQYLLSKNGKRSCYAESQL
jgi:hypothetical protein